jgi:hypothetical protein
MPKRSATSCWISSTEVGCLARWRGMTSAISSVLSGRAISEAWAMTRVRAP